MAYFGASIFWRASQPVWSLARKRQHLLDLGQYGEQLRQFLMGEEEFPADMVLWSAVCRIPEPPPVISFPTGEVTAEDGKSFHRHTFDIPGLSYMLYVGRCVPKRVRDLCMIRSPRRLLFFSPVERIIERNTARFFESHRRAHRCASFTAKSQARRYSCDWSRLGSRPWSLSDPHPTSTPKRRNSLGEART